MAQAISIQTAASPGLPPQFICREAGHAAEQARALPANLLISVGMVESGRVDPLTGQLAPWPWTVNVDGAGHYFVNKQDAVAFARLAESSGARDVDVGCFQISLQQHPGAFASLDAAFDPASNADFAGRFLDGLKIQTGTWNAAIADYHSALPELGLPYQRRVLDAWQHLGGMPQDSVAGLLIVPDASIILESPSARQVRVITFDGETGPPFREWLPSVITP